MAASRYYEQRWLLDPAKFISFTVIAPVGISTFVDKFIANNNHAGIYVGISSIPVGLYLVFKNSADDLLESSNKKIKQMPSIIKSFAAAALSTTVTTKACHEIKPYDPIRVWEKNRVVVELKC